MLRARCVPPGVSMRPLRSLLCVLWLVLLLHSLHVCAESDVANASVAVSDELQSVGLTAAAAVAPSQPVSELKREAAVAAAAEVNEAEGTGEARSDEVSPAAELSVSFPASPGAEQLLSLFELEEALCGGDNASVAGCNQTRRPQLQQQQLSQPASSASPDDAVEEQQPLQQPQSPPLPAPSSSSSSSLASPSPLSAAPKRNPLIELKENVMKQLEEKQLKEEKLRARGGGAADEQQQDDAPPADSDAPLLASILASTAPAAAAVSSSSSVGAAPLSAAEPPSESAPDGVILPASSILSASDRFNYAAYDSGAKLLASSPRMQSASSVLVSDDDRYMMVPCSEPSKWLVLQLKEDILLQELELHNLEHYSSSVRRFDLYGSAAYPTDDWLLLGRFHAPLSHHPLLFSLPNREQHVRYLRLHWLSQWKEEYYCTLTHLRVFGRSVLEAFKDDLDSSAEAVRQVELVLEQTEQQTAAGTSSSSGSAISSRTVDAAGSEQDATEGASEAGGSSAESDSCWQLFSAGSGDAETNAAAGCATSSAAVPVVIATDSAAAFRTQHGFVSPSACAPVPASSLICLLNRTDPPSDAASRRSLQSAVTTELRVGPVGILLIPPPAAGTAAAEAEESSVTSSESPAASSATVRVEVMDDSPAEAAAAALDAAAAAAAPASAPAAAAAAAVSASSSSLFSGAVSASELIYSQMARLGAQAGRQSQAEAEAAASQIDPAYVERFARYSTRAADALSAASASYSESGSSQRTAATAHGGEVETAGGAELDGSKPAVLAEDGAAAVAGSRQGRSSGGGGSHQSIFRTLTNRLKELEIHQALSTHFVSVLSGRFADDIAQLQTRIAAISTEMDRDRDRDRERDRDDDRDGMQPQRLLPSGRIAAVVAGGSSGGAEETDGLLLLQAASVTPGGAASPTVQPVDAATLRATVAAELRAELQQEMRQTREAQAALEQQLAELRASLQAAPTFQLPLWLPRELLPALLLLVATHSLLHWLLSLLSFLTRTLQAIFRHCRRLFPFAVFSSSRQAVKAPADPAAAVSGPSPTQRRSSSAETPIPRSLVKKSRAQSRGREEQQLAAKQSQGTVKPEPVALSAAWRRPSPSQAQSLPLCAHCLSSSPHCHAGAASSGPAAAAPPPVSLASSSAVSGSSWPPPAVAVSASSAQLGLEESKEEQRQAGAAVATPASARSASPSTVVSSSSSAGHRSGNSFSVLQHL